MPQLAHRTYDVITFSDMCVDLVLTGRDVSPQFGQVEKLVEGYTLELGGSSNLFACQCARLGLKTAVLGRVGDDSFGHLVLKRLNENGVDTRHVSIDPALKTGLGVALCPPGDRAILTYLGTIDAVYPEDVTDDILASARHIHHGSFYLHTRLIDALPKIFTRAHQMGCTTSLDTNWDPLDQWGGGLERILPQTDIFLPNEQEALRISHTLSGGDETASYREEEVLVARAAHRFLSLGAGYVAVKAGERGAGLYTTEISLKATVQPVTGGDGIGAGDSFDAGFIAAWLRGYSPESCLKIGLACGRAVAAHMGGLAGQPSWEDVAP